MQLWLPLQMPLALGSVKFVAAPHADAGDVDEVDDAGADVRAAADQRALF